MCTRTSPSSRYRTTSIHLPWEINSFLEDINWLLSQKKTELAWNNIPRSPKPILLQGYTGSVYEQKVGAIKGVCLLRVLYIGCVWRSLPLLWVWHLWSMPPPLPRVPHASQPGAPVFQEHLRRSASVFIPRNNPSLEHRLSSYRPGC